MVQFLTLSSFFLLGLVFDGKDSQRQKIKVGFEEVLNGLKEPTDIQFHPSDNNLVFVSEKAGHLRWFNTKNRHQGVALKISVLTTSEQGLLGFAFHPDFSKKQFVYINYSTESQGKRVSRVSEWRMYLESHSLSSERIILEVEQPYVNHNAGQLAFGLDGYLYIGWGDGGSGGDPHGHGQNAKTWLGSMLRIDINSQSDGRPYTIPSDNPFLKNPDFLPETWAWGLRNPWRYSFDREGRLIVADVGQNQWEEISVIEKGKNYGWNLKEGSHCFLKTQECYRKDLQDPVMEYGHDEGQSITGGYVYFGRKIPKLINKYIFGDFVTGRMWAIQIPKKSKVLLRDIYALGRSGFNISTFGQDSEGEVYVADFRSGRVYKIIDVKE